MSVARFPFAGWECGGGDVSHLTCSSFFLETSIFGVFLGDEGLPNYTRYARYPTSCSEKDRELV